MNTETQPRRVAAVGEALHYLRMEGAFYCRSEFTDPFGLDLPAMEDTLMFHVVTEGRCLLQVPDEEPCSLQPGDLALVPHGRGHRLLSHADCACQPLFETERQQLSERYESLSLGGGGATTIMLCGAVSFDHPAARQLVKLLPAILHVNAWSAPEADWLQSTLRFISTEARQMRLGGETIITRLCDVMVIQAIRAWVDTSSMAQTGWLGALHDRQIGRALAAVHRNPEQSWTVPELAAQSRMSRSAFTARFGELVGEPPMRYVTRFRMQAALGRLRDRGDTVAAVAERLGYQSEAAFSRAFKKATGLSPGAARRAAA